MAELNLFAQFGEAPLPPKTPTSKPPLPRPPGSKKVEYLSFKVTGPPVQPPLPPGPPPPTYCGDGDCWQAGSNPYPSQEQQQYCTNSNAHTNNKSDKKVVDWGEQWSSPKPKGGDNPNTVRREAIRRVSNVSSGSAKSLVVVPDMSQAHNFDDKLDILSAQFDQLEEKSNLVTHMISHPDNSCSNKTSSPTLFTSGSPV